MSFKFYSIIINVQSAIFILKSSLLNPIFKSLNKLNGFKLV